MSELSSLLAELKVSSERVTELQQQLTANTDENQTDNLTTQLEAARTADAAVRGRMLIELNKSQVDTPKTTVEVRDKTDDVHIVSSGAAICRIPPPKQYNTGDNFTTWGSRFKRYIRMSNTKISPSELLLNSVDDTTLDKLEPVVQRLESSEREDLDTFVAICENTLYPKSEIRALRQELNGKISQTDDENVEEFAARIRRIANRAYSNPPDREEPSLNALLNGMKDDSLYEKIITVGGAEDSFELAVEAARKFEKMKLVRGSSGSTSSATRDTELLEVNRVHQLQRQSREPTDGTEEPNSDRPRRSDSLRQHSPERNHRGRQHRNSSTRGRGRPDNRQCYRCHEFGHIARLCRAPIPSPLNYRRAGTEEQL